MKIEERNEGPAVVMSPAGRLDAAGAPELEARIAAVARTAPGRLVAPRCGGGPGIPAFAGMTEDRRG